MVMQPRMETPKSLEKGIAPFAVERVPTEQVPSVKIKGGKLVVNDIESNEFNYVAYPELHKNGLYSFQYETEDDLTHKRFINPADPQKVFPVIDIDTNKRVHVKKFQWTALNGKKFTNFSSGFTASVDAVTGAIVFYTNNDESNDEGSEVIVNNIPWRKNKFEHVQSVESYNSRVLAIANKKDEESRLFVNDAQWVWNSHEEPEINRREIVEDAISNGNGTIAAMVSSARSKNGKRFEHLFVGDEIAAKKEWKTIFDEARPDKRPKIVVDPNSTAVATVGMIEGVPTLVLNDVACKLNSEPHKVEKIRIENGEVFIQYINAIGEEIAEKVSLNDSAPEIQEAKKKEESGEEALAMLRKIMHEKAINPVAVIETLLSHGELKIQLQKEKAISDKVYELQNTNHVLQSDNKILADAVISEQNKNAQMQIELHKEIQKINEIAALVESHKPGGKMFGNGDKLKEPLYNLFKEILGSKLAEVDKVMEKHQEKKAPEQAPIPAKQPDGFGFKF